jgi:hypothetical protein
MGLDNQTKKEKKTYSEGSRRAHLPHPSLTNTLGCCTPIEEAFLFSSWIEKFQNFFEWFVCLFAAYLSPWLFPSWLAMTPRRGL